MKNFETTNLERLRAFNTLSKKSYKKTVGVRFLECILTHFLMFVNYFFNDVLIFFIFWKIRMILLDYYQLMLIITKFRHKYFLEWFFIVVKWMCLAMEEIGEIACWGIASHVYGNKIKKFCHKFSTGKITIICWMIEDILCYWETMKRCGGLFEFFLTFKNFKNN